MIAHGASHVAVAAVLAILAAGCGGSAAEKLASDDAAERIEALRDLGRSGRDEDVDRASRAAAHADLATARAAVRALGRMRGKAAAGALSRLAAEEQRSRVREAAVVELSHRHEAALAEVFRDRLLSDPSPTVRAAAATAMQRLGDWDGLDVLIRVAEQDESPFVRSRAVGAIERMASIRFGYSPSAPEAERQEALERIRRWAENRLLGDD